MIFGKVIGNVVSSHKVSALTGKKFFVVEGLTVKGDKLEPTGRHFVSLDAVGVGEGALVLCVQGSSARMSEGMEKTPTDAVIVGIIDSVNFASNAKGAKKGK